MLWLEVTEERRKTIPYLFKDFFYIITGCYIGHLIYAPHFQWYLNKVT